MQQSWRSHPDHSPGRQKCRHTGRPHQCVGEYHPVAGISNGKGPANAILKDSMMVYNLNQSLANIQEGTYRFNQVMEALKHNFLLRSYFRKQEKQKAKSDRNQTVHLD